jgi:hypothetical protein
MQQAENGPRRNQEWNCPELTVLVHTTAAETILTACKASLSSGEVNDDTGCQGGGPVCSVCYDLESS